MYYDEVRRVEYTGHYDVIVVGGGVAGIGAAIAAAREGMSVLIMEKTICLGGQATLGHVVKYEPMDDGYGRQVIGGISEELLKKSILYGYDNLPVEWKHKLNIIDDKPTGSGHFSNPDRRLATFFNIPAFVLALDEMMDQEGIDVLFDTLFCAPIMEGAACTGLIVETKSGRHAYGAKMVVDASGDADVLSRCGANCVDQDNFVTYMCYDIDFDRMKDAIEHEDMFRAIPIWRMLGYDPLTHEGQSPTKYYGTTLEGVNGFVKASRRAALAFLKTNQRRDYTMLSVPAITAFRTTRRIKGLYELKAEDVHKRFDDSIGCAGDWRKAGPVYEIPYRTLIDAKLPNVVAVGRIIASGGDAWEITRVIPPAVMTGQAGGTAAAMAIKDKKTLQQVDVGALQKKLEKTGVVIHY
jgi:hypothetical protein